MTNGVAAGDKAKLLAGHWLFAGFDDRDLAGLARHARTERRKAREVIFRKGDPGNSLMAVLSGRVKIRTTYFDGKELVLGILGAGQVFGEIALLDGLSRTADAVTMEPTELLVLDRRDFLPFLARRPEVCIKLLTVLAERLRGTNQRVEDMQFLLQSPRLAKTLLRLGREYGTETTDGVVIDLRLSQREWGALVGMTREGLNRQISSWRDEGLIDIRDGLILIRDRRGLELRAEAPAE